MIAQNKYYQWERFWCPAGGSYSLDYEGFLVDPESTLGRPYSSVALKFEDIPTVSCFVLLGEPGIGKTNALQNAFKESAFEKGSKAIWFDLCSYSSDIGLTIGIESNPEVQNWFNGDNKLVLFLDSLDEGLLNVRTISRVLLDLLSRWPRDRLEIRLACRTADWPKSLDRGLCSLFELDELPKYELLPLRKKDIVSAANVEGVNADLFIKVIQDVEISSFAIRPVTLKFLLNSFKNNGNLPTNKSQIFWAGCLQLCEEGNENRLASKQKGRLTAIQKLIVASRIAAVMVFSNKFAIWTDVEGNVPDVDVAIRTLSGYSEEVDGIVFPVDEEAIRETLATGLFSSRGESQIGFSHNTYAEYLAAYYLTKRQVPLAKIMGFITASDGKIIPQLQEIAVWLATFSGITLGALLDLQPDVILHVDKSILTIPQRKKFLARLLDEYQSGHSTDYFDSIKYFNRLCYDGMHNQLTYYIQNRENKLEVRCMAILVARECAQTQVVNLLVSLALDKTESFRIREYAANAVRAIGNKDASMRLMPLALGEAGEDPDDELKGIGLEAVCASQVSISDLLATIKPLKNTNLIGSYYHFLAYEFPETVPIDDLARILKWLLEDKPYLGSEVLEDSMIQRLMLRAWDHIEEPLVAEPFSKLAYRRLLSHRESKGSIYDKTYLDYIDKDTNKRHILVEQIVGLMDSTYNAFYLVFNLPILFREDVDWVVAKIEATGQDPKSEIWGQLLFYLTDFRNPDEVTRVYYVCERFPRIATIFSRIFEPVELDSELATNLREYEKQSKEIERAQADKIKKEINYELQLTLRIDQFAQGDIDAWWRLNLLFLSSNPDQPGNEFDTDLRSFSLWQKIDNDVKKNLISIAYQFLIEYKQCDIWLPHNRIYRPAISAFRAFYLLANEGQEYINNLPSEIWGKWASVLLSFPVLSSTKYAIEVHQLLIQRLFEMAEEKAQVQFESQIQKGDSDANTQSILQLIEHIKSNMVFEVLIKALKENNLSVISYQLILEFLLKHNIQAAKQIALEAVLNESIELEKRLATGRSLIVYSADAGWPEIGQLIKQDMEFGKRLFLGLSYNHENLARILVYKLSEENTGELFAWLEAGFPREDDPDIGGFHAISEREEVGHFRDWLMAELSGRGTPKACDVIRHLAERYSDNTWILNYLHACEKSVRRNSWSPSEPYIFLQIARNAYLEYLNRKQRIQNLIIYSLTCVCTLFLDILLNLLDYENNVIFSFLASQQLLITVAIIFLVGTLIIISSNKPASE